MRTITKEIFDYDELSDTAKDKAKELITEINFSCDYWFEGTKDFFIEILSCFGFSGVVAYHNCSFTQGAGASFEGRFKYEEFGDVTLLTLTDNREMIALMDVYLALQRKYSNKLTGKVYNVVHRYYHEYEMNIDEEEDREESLLLEIFRGLARQYYKMLLENIEYIESEEYVSDFCDANEYEFNEDGTFYS